MIDNHSQVFGRFYQSSLDSYPKSPIEGEVTCAHCSQAAYELCLHDIQCKL